MAEKREHRIPEVNAAMDKWKFDQVERDLVINLADDAPLLPTLLIGTATTKFAKSLQTWTKWLTIFTIILAISTAIQVFLAFCH